MQINSLSIFSFARLTFCCLISLQLIASVDLAAANHFPPDEDKMAEPAKRLTPELIWKMGRLGATAVSPSGQKIAYTVTHYRLSENNSKTSLYLYDVKSKSVSLLLQDWKTIAALQWNTNDSGEVAGVFFLGKPDTEKPENKSPDKKTDSDKTFRDKPQAWYVDLESSATNQLTAVEEGISTLKIAPNRKQLAFTSRVKLNDTVNDLYQDLPKADARIIDSLMYRHWDSWHDFKFSHLFVAEIAASGSDSQLKCGQPIDLMEGMKVDCPVPPFGGGEQITWSPGSEEIAFVMKPIGEGNGTPWAQSTDSNVFLIKPTAGSQPVNITKGMEGYDRDPEYSPDGKTIAFSSMQRAGFESDRNRIMLYDRSTQQRTELTVGLDQNANGKFWTEDAKTVFFTSEIKGTVQIFQLAVDAATGEAANELKQVSSGRFNWSIESVMPDQRHLLVQRMDMLRPAELFLMDVETGKAEVLTHINDEIYADLQLPVVEERYVTATDGQKIHTWVLHPPGFDAKSKKKWPMLTFCQGGPQGQVDQVFSNRWNFGLMASQGYVVVAPNRRGLPGFGRKWNDQISGDWGGQAMNDLLSVTDDVAAEPYVDAKRLGAVGASFGGYSVYWLMSHHENRFAAMIAHCGVFNLESMYGSTEELFFVNWDLGGPYWANDELAQQYEKFSPHKFVKSWKTPLLVIHNEKDFRVPVTQGMEAFTAAQVQNVPSRFLYFPEEGHWVNSPQNSVLWQRVFFDWLERYCPPGVVGVPTDLGSLLTK